MLPPNYFDKISKQCVSLYETIELEIIKEIAKRIKAVGYANTVVENNVKISQQMGFMYENIINTIAKENNKRYEDILRIFTDAGIIAIKNDDKIYKKAGLNPLPIKQDKSMLQILTATAVKTDRNLSNLTMTTATNTQQDFYNSMNKAYMEVSTGVKSYTQAIIDSIDELSAKGSYVTYPSGYKTSLENAVRTNIITGVSQTCGTMQELRANELDWDLMELTAHSGARPTHEVWQGKIVSLSGKPGYLSKVDIGYGEITGFKGINCRHDWYPYYAGSSKTYSDEQLEEWKNEKVIYNGKEMSVYEASQIQRRMERQIRVDKKKLEGINELLKNANLNEKEIIDLKTAFGQRSLYYNSHKKELNNFVDSLKSKEDNSRIYIGKQDKIIMKNVNNVKKIANKYNNKIKGTIVYNTKIKEISEHVIARTYARDIDFEDVQDTLNNPIKHGIIRVDKSQQIFGENCAVVINTETGKLITVFPKKTQRKE